MSDAGFGVGSKGDPISFGISQHNFKVGDIITGVNNTEVKSTTELKAVIKKLSVGDKVKFTVYRSGQKGTIQMQLEESKADVNASSDSQSKSTDDWTNNPWSIFN